MNNHRHIRNSVTGGDGDHQPVAQCRELGGGDRDLEEYQSHGPLVWGEQDWANAAERDHDRSLLPGAQVTTIENGGHFLPLDRPKELHDLILRFAPLTAANSAEVFACLCQQI
jgi:pimeloyl-ACP methyl ester carboxylesterase